MNPDKDKITVYYDGTCPSCVKDRSIYEKLCGSSGRNVRWFDISGQEAHLQKIGIDPIKALMELHIQNEKQQILSEIDAYILLMRKAPLLRPVAWLIGLPLIRPILSRIYHRRVNRRLQRTGRLKKNDMEAK